MKRPDPVNILLVDDQPAKLMSYEAVLADLGETLLRANSAREALHLLLNGEVAVILADVCMPDLDGFQMAQMIREHPRFQHIAIVFISAVQLSDEDRVRGYQLGAVDYVPVPIVPELLRAKVRVFAELYRKNRQLEHLNQSLELRVAERTAELQHSHARLRLALDIARLGTWDWDLDTDKATWSESYCAMLGYEPGAISSSYEAWRARVHPEDAEAAEAAIRHTIDTGAPFRHVYRVVRSETDHGWLETRGQLEFDATGRPRRMLGVAMDVTEYKASEERQMLMLRELHHRVKNTLATVQAIANLSARNAHDIDTFRDSFSTRIQSLGRTHTMLVAANWQAIEIRAILQGELGSFNDRGSPRIDMAGPAVELPSETALSLGLAVHELTTNAVKHGALSVPDGRVLIAWSIADHDDGAALEFEWKEAGGPQVFTPKVHGFGSLLLQRLFSAQTKGSAEISYPASGVVFRAMMPLAQAKAPVAERQTV